MPDDQYRRTLEELFRLRRFGVQPGLDVIHALLEALDHPERRFPAVHITGSKGNGSVAAMVEALLRAHGRKTGLFTSPHLVSYRERVQVDRSPIPKADVVTSVRRVRGIAAELEAQGAIDHPPTFFEVTTAVALDYFARAQVDAAVVEVGMGGRLDATNVLAARAGVITTVELEHTELLGPTVEAIAREKSGIFHRGMTGVVGELPPAADRVVSELAGSAGIPVWHLGREVRVV